MFLYNFFYDIQHFRISFLSIIYTVTVHMHCILGINLTLNLNFFFIMTLKAVCVSNTTGIYGTKNETHNFHFHFLITQI